MVQSDPLLQVKQELLAEIGEFESQCVGGSPQVLEGSVTGR